jgi:DNA-binding transcriptional MerR regulator
MRKRKRRPFTPKNLVSPSQGKEISGYSTAWLRELARRGVIQPAMTMPDGDRLYYREDMIRLARRTPQDRREAARRAAQTRWDRVRAEE